MSVITITWTSSVSPDNAGYKVYYGTVSGSYDKVVDAGFANSLTIEDLLPGVIYYYTVTAYDWFDNESDPAPEQSITTDLDTPETGLEDGAVVDNNGRIECAICGFDYFRSQLYMNANKQLVCIYDLDEK